MIAYKEDLDMLKCLCGMPACESRVIFHSDCHLNAPTWCEYFNGVLKVFCSVCSKTIVEIKVAKKCEG